MSTKSCVQSVNDTCQNFIFVRVDVNFKASQKLNFHSMKELVLIKKLDEKISVEQNTLIRNKSNWSIRTEVINKLYRISNSSSSGLYPLILLLFISSSSLKSSLSLL